MNLTRPSELRALLDRLGIRPRKSLGQHFLIDRNILDILMNAASVGEGDKVLEVGPGLGTVTERLLEAGAEVTAVEKDTRMLTWLRERFADASGLNLLHEDALHTNWNRLLDRCGETKVVANLPYGVGSRVLVDWTRADAPPSRIVVTVQMEVAKRLTSEAGDGNYGLLTLWARLRYDAAIVKAVSRTCFLPPPAVTSAIVRMDRHDRVNLSDRSAAVLQEIAVTAFHQRRKQLATSLAHRRPAEDMTSAGIGGVLESMGLNPQARPADLSMENWCEFAERLGSAKFVDRGETSN